MMFKYPFSFEGRIRRTEYGITLLLYTVAAFVINLMTIAVGESGGGERALILLVLYIPLIWFVWAQGAKRCHDRNNSGWYQIIPFYSLWMLFGDGDTGANLYGEDPKGRSSTYSDSNILDTPETF